MACNARPMAKFFGKVSRKRVASASKSEHEAVILETAKGEFLLRRLGGPGFDDPQVDCLVGHKVEVEGRTQGNWLLFSTCQLRES